MSRPAAIWKAHRGLTPRGHVTSALALRWSCKLCVGASIGAIAVDCRRRIDSPRASMSQKT